MSICVSTLRDVQVWAANAFPELSDADTDRIGQSVWDRDDFPHPVNNTDVTAYLDGLDIDWLMAATGPEEA